MTKQPLYDVETIREYVMRRLKYLADAHDAKLQLLRELNEALKDSPEWRAGKPVAECMSEEQYERIAAKHPEAFEHVSRDPRDPILDAQLAEYLGNNPQFSEYLGNQLNDFPEIARELGLPFQRH